MSDRFVTRGLLIGAVLCLGLALPWYLTWGYGFFELQQRLSSASLGQFRGFRVYASGFNEVKPSFWWYAQTAPGAMSNVLAIFALVGLIVCLLKRRAETWLLVIAFLSTYTMLSLQQNLGWRSMASVLPVAAVLTATALTEFRPKWLSASLIAISLAVGASTFSVVTWGAPLAGRRLVTALGAPLESRTCENRRSMAFCPAPAEADQDPWQVGEMLDAIFGDVRCQRPRTCSLFIVRAAQLRRPRFDIVTLLRSHLANRWPDARLSTSQEESRNWGEPYKIKALLRSDYIIYLDAPLLPNTPLYRAATVEFLQDPPAPFAEAHRAVRFVEVQGGARVTLLRRIKSLTLEEAEASIAALKIPDRYKSEQYAVLAPLYAAEGDLERVIELYDATSDRRGRATARRMLADRYQRRGQTEWAIALYKEALAIDPNDARARRALARIGR